MRAIVTTSAAVAAFGLLVLAGCAVTGSLRPQRQPSPPHPTAPADTSLMSDDDRARITALAAERAHVQVEDGYRIGPDDLLDIRIPDLLEAQAPAATRLAQSGGMIAVVAGAPVFEQGIRVNGQGEVSIPTLGMLHAEGLTATALEGEIGRRLKAAGILRAPQVSVQVAEYRSGVVAVIGSVERPGLYPLTRPGATLADLLWAAGGPSKDAGRVVEFVAARPTDAAPAGHPDVVPATPSTYSPVMAPPAPTRVAATEVAGDSDAETPIRVDLRVLLRGAGREERGVNPRVWPGDVISIAPAGSVHVHGWVEKPGSYPLDRGLTLSGAVAAAGGRQFSADLHRATVTRVLGPGEQRSFTVDLEAVAGNRAADVPLTDGDVVHLPAAPWRLVPWGVWTVARTIVHIGGSVLLF